MAHEITYNNFEKSLVVFMPNITTNHAITYTNLKFPHLDFLRLIVQKKDILRTFLIEK